MRDLVFLFPGQGAQYVGMGRQLWDRYRTVQILFEEASDLLGQDLRTLCFEGPDATLVQTEHVQPAITLVNLACLHVVREEGFTPSAVAGHSLGEYAALCAADVLTFSDTMRLVHARGLAMQQAANRNPGGMLAVYGLSGDALRGYCDALADLRAVQVANYNSPQQIILTGERSALQQAGALAKAKGAKLVVPLKVSGPWHSRFMQDASEWMGETLRKCHFDPPAIPVVANVTGRPYPADPDAIRAGLVAQMVRPVLWADSISWLSAEGYRHFIELGPGRVLTGLMRDISREVKVFNVQDADTLSKFLASEAAFLSV